LEEANLVNTLLEKERHNQGKIDKVEKREKSKKKTFRRNRQSGKEREKKKLLGVRHFCWRRRRRVASLCVHNQEKVSLSVSVFSVSFGPKPCFENDANLLV
jgi:hypothetical protein